MRDNVFSAILHIRDRLDRIDTWLGEPNLELGDDPLLASTILHELVELLDYTRIELHDEYTLSKKRLQASNPYHSIIIDLSNAIDFVKSVQLARRGASSKTRQLQLLLSHCSANVSLLAGNTGATETPGKPGDGSCSSGENNTMQPIGNEQIKPTIGLVTALPKEYAAAQVMLDKGRDHYTSNRRVGEQYYLGEIPAGDGGQHTIVLSLTVGMGNNMAALSADNLLRDFPTVGTVIMVGIAGGVPYPEKPDEHVRLGDIVVSNEQGIVHYDFVKQEINNIKPRHSNHRPSARLLHAARRLEAREISQDRQWGALADRAKRLREVARPRDEEDILQRFVKAKTGDYVAQERISHPADSKRVAREPRVFLGPIASSNTLQKDPFKRDALRDQYGVKAIEMEGSGIADATWIQGADYLVVRGICDYCDPCKNDVWQGYAAVVAAAYTRALLGLLASDPSSVR